MRFLADESCDFSVVRALRAEGHDVMAIAEVSPREEDDDVRERAVKDNRLLITEDKDFVSWYMRTCAVREEPSLFAIRPARVETFLTAWLKQSNSVVDV